MANSSKLGRAHRKDARKRGRAKDVQARARKSAKKRKSARATRAAARKTTPKTPPA